ncbi:MAG: hypothetical protein GX130_10210 [Candidatus Hydrogenedens sp.]|nr:hypothetical protein [Candidatus Hydrogenedens sp.]
MLFIPSICCVKTSSRDRHDSRGAALFIAIAMLALFSLLGVSYVRFLMVEEDLNTLEVRKLRSQYYAEAGIHCASAYLQETLRKGALPVTSTTYNFPVYGLLQGTPPERPAQLENYHADVAVTLVELSDDEWESHSLSLENYPGSGRAWAVESSAVLMKETALTDRPLSRHTLTAILSVDEDTTRILSWHTGR